MSVRNRLLAICILLGVARMASAQTFPAELQRDALARSCTPVVDTAGFPGLERPLFLASTQRPELSALYWCTREDSAAKSFLIFLRPPRGCPEELPYWNPPGGLSVESPLYARLSEYRPVLAPETVGPDTVVTTVGIRAEYDGAGGTFVCHDGKWYVAQFH